MAEDAEVGSKTSSKTRWAKNLSASVDMAEDAEVGEDDDDDDETVKRLSLFKKPNVFTGYSYLPLLQKKTKLQVQQIELSSNPRYVWAFSMLCHIDY